MPTIRYQTDDGRLFATRSEALAHEVEAAERAQLAALQQKYAIP